MVNRVKELQQSLLLLQQKTKLPSLTIHREPFCSDQTEASSTTICSSTLANNSRKRKTLSNSVILYIDAYECENFHEFPSNRRTTHHLKGNRHNGFIRNASETIPYRLLEMKLFKRESFEKAFIMIFNELKAKNCAQKKDKLDCRWDSSFIVTYKNVPIYKTSTPDSLDMQMTNYLSVFTQQQWHDVCEKHKERLSSYFTLNKIEDTGDGDDYINEESEDSKSSEEAMLITVNIKDAFNQVITLRIEVSKFCFVDFFFTFKTEKFNNQRVILGIQRAREFK